MMTWIVHFYFPLNVHFYFTIYRQAYKKAADLAEKDRIELKEAAIENYYNKEKQKLYVTVVIFDFEKVEKEERKE